MLTAEQAKAAYDAAVAALGTPVTPNLSRTPTTLPEAYVDFEFGSEGVMDAKGNVTVTNKGASFGKTNVTVNGKTYEVDALQITESGTVCALRV